MHVIPLLKINQFLPVNKLQVSEAQHDVWLKDLEETARDIVKSRLAVSFDTSTWVDHTATPKLVVSIMGMLTAGWLYDRQFAEETETGTSYGTRKVREAYSLLDGILDGTYDIGLDHIVDPELAPSYLETDPVFLMGERF